MPVDHADCYRNEIEATLPRLLALFDTNRLSPTYGQGDRLYWSWKLIDFGNGTFQGAAHGLARLLAADLLPVSISEGVVLDRITAMFHGADTLRRRNGSLEEAFPHESSFCVTALVAFDLLASIDLLDDRLDGAERDRRLAVVRPMIRFLHRTDETHGFIANHLATAAAALVHWTALTGEPGEDRGRVLLDRILAHQSSEGWFPEYGGADPAYQTLCQYYLATLHRRRPDLDLGEPLRRSTAFLAHFVHPDGSFGGHYGSRYTRLHCPAGFETLAADVAEAAAIATRMRQSIAERTTPTLTGLDAPNLVPMFNAYCQAAAAVHERGDAAPAATALPATTGRPERIELPEAGLVIDVGPDHYTVVSWKNGGVLYHFARDPETGWRRDRMDVGVAVRSRSGRVYTTLATQADNRWSLDDDVVTVQTPLVAVRNRRPGPFSFAVLRLLGITVLRSATLLAMTKKTLVWLLFARRDRAPVTNRRTIRLGREPVVTDELDGLRPDDERIDDPGPFLAVHMASSGYWQRQDDDADPLIASGTWRRS